MVMAVWLCLIMAFGYGYCNWLWQMIMANGYGKWLWQMVMANGHGCSFATFQCNLHCPPCLTSQGPDVSKMPFFVWK